jgi:hypothetical protein
MSRDYKLPAIPPESPKRIITAIHGISGLRYPVADASGGGRSPAAGTSTPALAHRYEQPSRAPGPSRTGRLCAACRWRVRRGPAEQNGPFWRRLSSAAVPLHQHRIAYPPNGAADCSTSWPSLTAIRRQGKASSWDTLAEPDARTSYGRPETAIERRSPGCGLAVAGSRTDEFCRRQCRR